VNYEVLAEIRSEVRMEKKYSEEKIVQILNEVTPGAKVLETCRRYGISEAAYYNWKAKYAGMGVRIIQRLKELESSKAETADGFRRAIRKKSAPK